MSKHSILLLTLVVVCSTLSAQTKSARIDKNLSIYTDVMRELDINYVDTLNYEDLVETSINQMLYRIDPYTVYIPQREDDNLRMMTTGKYGGIGAIIMMRDSDVYINEPYENMPAALCDLQAGDRIVSINGVSCHRKNTKQVSDMLRGKAETTIHIVLDRQGETIERDVTRREIHLPAVAYATVMQDSIAYISFTEFTENSAQAFLMALDSLVQHFGTKRLIMDLRSNGGGIIDEAIQMVSYFVPKGTEVVSTKGKTERSCHSYITQTGPIFPSIPIVILVNNQSASAAEIVSGSLQDLHRATLVGQRTFGKGLVQNVRPIAYGGHLKVTTAKYYLPSGRCIQAIDYSERQKGNQLHRDTAGGILPDVVLSDSQKVDICYSLYRDHLFFDYATRYHRQHPTLIPATQFTLTDADIEDFYTFLEEKQFTYETETGKNLKELIRMAKNEDIDSTLIQSLQALQPAFNGDYRAAIQRNRTEVERYLGSDVVLRYWFQKGHYAYTLRFDDELKRAIQEVCQ